MLARVSTTIELRWGYLGDAVEINRGVRRDAEQAYCPAEEFPLFPLGKSGAERCGEKGKRVGVLD